MQIAPRELPTDAEEIILNYWADGSPESAHYRLSGDEIVYRAWDEAGRLIMEYGLAGGKQHGWFFTWHENGQLSERVCYGHGVEHGVHEQYDEDGALIGSSVLEHGTGADLWYARAGVLSEERYYLAGQRHGIERWWNEDNQTVYEESHFWHGAEHGIFRRWNEHGRLRRGYPQYYIGGARVERRVYLQHATQDSSLPAFQASENKPARSLPDAVRSMIETKAQ